MPRVLQSAVNLGNLQLELASESSSLSDVASWLHLECDDILVQVL